MEETKTITYWWCRNCAEEVDPRCVTFQEMHDRCGHPVDAITEEVCGCHLPPRPVNDHAGAGS